MFKAKGKRQKAKGKNVEPLISDFVSVVQDRVIYIFAFCLLPFAF